MERLINPARQGDLGEVSAIDWLTRQGATVCAPLGHSPDYDLIAELDGRLLRVQVKTSTQSVTTPKGAVRYPLTMATSGGNQSWNRRIKGADPSRFDMLFALVGCGRRWFVPAVAIEASNVLALGGRKYSEFEIEPTVPITELVYGTVGGALDSSAQRGGVSKRSTDGDCKSSGSAFEGSNPSSSMKTPGGFDAVTHERGPQRRGQTVISRKRQLTIPIGPAASAGVAPGDRMRVVADGPGRIVLERIEEAPAKVPPLFAPG